MDARAVVFKNRGAILALPAIVLAAMGKPSALSIAFGLPLALLGEAIRCWAVGYSGTTTRADTVTAPRLVTAGPYAYVRNPLYVGNFLTAFGFALAFTGKNAPLERLGLVGLSLGTMVAVYAAIVPHEESFLRQTFGVRYDEYAARVPRVFALRPGAPSQEGTYDPSVIVRAESRTFATFAAMLAILGLKAAVAP